MLVLYTTSQCPDCKRIKEYMNTNYIKYEEKILNAEALTDLRIDGIFQCCAPILKTDSEYIFGAMSILRWLYENCVHGGTWSR